jgi:chromosomal replication initiation ATPase DnaA
MKNENQIINNKVFHTQLALPLKFKTLNNSDNFIISDCNKDAVALIDNFDCCKNNKNINSMPAIIIYGPKGSGKTHISSIYQQQVDCINLSSITSKEIRLAEKGSNFIVDNFFPSKNFPSEMVMHFLNEVKYSSGSVLFLSRFSAFNIDWGLDDLNSRMRSLISCEIKLPDEILLYTILVKYSEDKKLILNDKQCLYIIERIERNFETVISVIDNLDRVSLETKKKITYETIQNIINLMAINKK